VIIPHARAGGNAPPTISPRSRSHLNDPWTPCPPRSGGELAQLRYAAAEARLRALRLSHALHRLLAIVEGRS